MNAKKIKLCCRTLVLILLPFIGTFIASNLYCQTSSSNATQLFNDDTFHFSLQIPTDWQTKKRPTDNSSLRIALESPDSTQMIFVYAFKTDAEVDLEKFAESDTLLFNDLGERVDSRKIWKFWFFYLTGIENNYKTDKIKTKLLFSSQSNFGYVIMRKGYNEDFSKFSEVCKSFKINVPFSNRFSVWLSGLFHGIGGWIIGIIGLIILLGVASLIGSGGKFIKKNMSIKKQLNKVKYEALRDGNTLTEKWNEINIKTVRNILFALTGIIIIYLVLFNLLSTRFFLLSLLGLVPLILGYFGIFFTLSDEIEDYLD